jgi:uncharacterized membrane protein YqgA involved in biofilm formation
MTGTFLNVFTVILGAALGTLMGARLPEKMRETVLAGLGIVVFIVGIGMALTGNVLIVMFALLFGAILGELLDIDAKLNSLGQMLEARFARGGQAGNFAKGFVTASLVFCVGPLTILGSIQDGLLGDYKLLAIKSILDGFAGLAFSASLGIGVGFAAITVLLFQGGISLLAMFAGSALGSVTRETPWVVQLTATGGAIVMGIGLLLLDVKRVRVANFLPALLIAPLIQLALDYFHFALP